MAQENNQLPLACAEPGKTTDGRGIMRMEKGADGWEAETDIKIDNPRLFADPRLLRITTSKSSCGGVTTDATVYAVNGHSISTALFGDFSKQIAHNAVLRCTEKTVTAQHFSVLNDLDKIKADLTAFYVAKNPKPWVAVSNPGMDNEDIVDDFKTYEEALACCAGLEDGEADVMRRRADGTLTSEF